MLAKETLAGVKESVAYLGSGGGGWNDGLVPGEGENVCLCVCV